MGNPVFVSRSWESIYGTSSKTQNRPSERKHIFEAKEKPAATRMRSSAIRPSDLKDTAQCLRCDRKFASWDRKKNRVCSECKSLNAKETRFSVYAGFDVVIPHQILESIIDNPLEVQDAY